MCRRLPGAEKRDSAAAGDTCRDIDQAMLTLSDTAGEPFAALIRRHSPIA
jgi:hypothetical protein